MPGTMLTFTRMHMMASAMQVLSRSLLGGGVKMVNAHDCCIESDRRLHVCPRR